MRQMDLDFPAQIVDYPDQTCEMAEPSEELPEEELLERSREVISLVEDEYTAVGELVAAAIAYVFTGDPASLQEAIDTTRDLLRRRA